MRLNLKDPERSGGEKDSPWAGASVLWGFATVVLSVVVGVYLGERGFRGAGDFLGYLSWVWGFFAWFAASLYYASHPRPPSRVLWRTPAWFGKNKGQFPGSLLWVEALEGATTRSTVSAFVVGIILFALLGAWVVVTAPSPPTGNRWALPSELQVTELRVDSAHDNVGDEGRRNMAYEMTALVKNTSTFPGTIRGELVALDCDGPECAVTGRGRLRVHDLIVLPKETRELKTTVWIDSTAPARHVRRWELRFDRLP